VSPRAGAEAEALHPWQLFTLAGLIGATIVVFMSRGQTVAGIVLLSCAVFSAAFVGLAALRTFLPLAGRSFGDGPEVLGGRTRAALEREKSLVLRSIKELEFDRGMGKVSEKDFVEMSARLRTRAARLMRQLDQGSVYRDQIEKEIEKRVGRTVSGPSAAAVSGPPTPIASGPPAPAVAAPPRASEKARAACPSCQTENDADARFCKNCGARMEGA
jgi:hypothetical protein